MCLKNRQQCQHDQDLTLCFCPQGHKTLSGTGCTVPHVCTFTCFPSTISTSLQLTPGQPPHPTPAGDLWSREHPFQGQCVSITRGHRAAWTQHGQIAAAHGKHYVPIITHYIQGFSVQEELCPVTCFQKGRNRCKWDCRAEEVLWAAVPLPSQQIPSLISHHYYSASAGRKQPWGPEQELRCPKSSQC